MPDYMVKFIAHIIEEFRPENFPKKVFKDMFVRVVNNDGLRAKTNEGLREFILNQGLIILKDPTIEVNEFRQDVQIFIPAHMISYLETETTRLAGQIPEEGMKVQLS